MLTPSGTVFETGLLGDPSVSMRSGGRAPTLIGLVALEKEEKPGRELSPGGGGQHL